MNQSEVNEEIQLKIDGVLQDNDVLDIELNDKIVDQLVVQSRESIHEDQQHEQILESAEISSGCEERDQEMQEKETSF